MGNRRKAVLDYSLPPFRQYDLKKVYPKEIKDRDEIELVKGVLEVWYQPTVGLVHV